MAIEVTATCPMVSGTARSPGLRRVQERAVRPPSGGAERAYPPRPRPAAGGLPQRPQQHDHQQPSRCVQDLAGVHGRIVRARRLVHRTPLERRAVQLAPLVCPRWSRPFPPNHRAAQGRVPRTHPRSVDRGHEPSGIADLRSQGQHPRRRSTPTAREAGQGEPRGSSPQRPPSSTGRSLILRLRKRPPQIEVGRFRHSELYRSGRRGNR